MLFPDTISLKNSVGGHKSQRKKNTQIQEFDLRMTRNDPKWTNMNKKCSKIIEILVKSLHFDGF